MQRIDNKNTFTDKSKNNHMNIFYISHEFIAASRLLIKQRATCIIYTLIFDKIKFYIVRWPCFF